MTTEQIQLDSKWAEQLKASALLSILCIAVLQLLFLSQRFDAYQLVQGQDGLGWKALFGYLGQVAKLFTVFCFLLLVAQYRQVKTCWTLLVENLNWLRYFACIALHLIIFVPIYILAKKIFDAPTLADVSALSLIVWLVLLVFWGGLGLAAITSFRTIFAFFKSEYRLITFVAVLALIVWSLASLSTSFWGPLSGFTFDLSSALLSILVGAEVYVDPAARNLGLAEFVVNIAPACSGYEGIGLVCSFIALYLYINKREFKFPQAFLLFPIGALAIWLLNVLRIVVLILIGEFWSEEVAVGGFHSQAGWLTFIVASLGILWAASSISFFTKSQPAPSLASPTNDSAGVGEDVDLAVATLVPMVVLLAVILLTGAINAGFDWLYPLRVLAVVAALIWAWPKFNITLPSSWLNIGVTQKCAESLLVGILVAVIWCLMLKGTGQEQDAFIRDSLAGQSAWVSGFWLVCRFLGTVITVPIAEELAFRAYLLCKLSSHRISLSGSLPMSVVAIAASSLAFGFLHGAWFAGTLAGVLYALIRYRTEHIGYVILAHGITNAIIFVFASLTGEWSLL